MPESKRSRVKFTGSILRSPSARRHKIELAAKAINDIEVKINVLSERILINDRKMTIKKKTLMLLH